MAVILPRLNIESIPVKTNIMIIRVFIYPLSLVQSLCFNNLKNGLSEKILSTKLFEKDFLSHLILPSFAPQE